MSAESLVNINTALASAVRHLWKRPVLSPGLADFLAAGIIVIIVALMTVTTMIDIRAKSSDARTTLQHNSIDLGALAHGVLPAPLAARDMQRLGAFSTALWAQTDISYVKIFASDGLLLVGPGPDQFPTGVRDASVVREVQGLHTVQRWTDDGLETTAPVTSGGELIGAVQFGVATDRLDSEIHALTVGRLWLTLFLICAGVTSSMLLSRYFAQPIRQLVTATKRIGAGDLTARIGELRGRELRELGQAFDHMAEDLQEKVGELQDSRARIVTVEESVREDIAHRLHEGAQGRMLALKAQLTALLRSGDVPDEPARHLTSIIDHMGEVIEKDIAMVSRRLYPSIIERGIVPSVQSLCDQFETVLDLEVSVATGLVERERTDRQIISKSVRLAAYRIADNALNNVLKHAPHSRVHVRLNAEPGDWLELVVSDDGPGFSVDHAVEGMGLAVMRDSAGAVGGTCVILSAPGRGTRVVARLPYAGV